LELAPDPPPAEVLAFAAMFRVLEKLDAQAEWPQAELRPGKGVILILIA